MTYTQVLIALAQPRRDGLGRSFATPADYEHFRRGQEHERRRFIARHVRVS